MLSPEEDLVKYLFGAHSLLTVCATEVQSPRESSVPWFSGTQAEQGALLGHLALDAVRSERWLEGRHRPWPHLVTYCVTRRPDSLNFRFLIYKMGGDQSLVTSTCPSYETIRGKGSHELRNVINRDGIC